MWESFSLYEKFWSVVWLIVGICVIIEVLSPEEGED